VTGLEESSWEKEQGASSLMKDWELHRLEMELELAQEQCN